MQASQKPTKTPAFTVKSIIEVHRANPGLKRTYPLAKTGVILESKVHSGAHMRGRL